MNKDVRCPKCNFKIKIIRETDWDFLETYFYPICEKCKWGTPAIFRNEKQVLDYIELEDLYNFEGVRL